MSWEHKRQPRRPQPLLKTSYRGHTAPRRRGSGSVREHWASKIPFCGFLIPSSGSQKVKEKVEFNTGWGWESGELGASQRPYWKGAVPWFRELAAKGVFTAAQR